MLTRITHSSCEIYGLLERIKCQRLTIGSIEQATWSKRLIANGLIEQ